MKHANVLQGRLIAITLLFCSFISFLSAQDLDISGWKVVQANASNTITFPSGTIVHPGGYVVIGRNITQSGFQTFWGVTLGANVTYIDGFSVVGSNGFPTINGSETYTLENASNVVIDGPTIAEPSSPGAQSIQRIRPGYPVAQESSWTRLSSNTITNATPGSGAGATMNAGLIINEFSDASTFNDEFVELFYDAAPPPTGKGTAVILSSLLKGNVVDTVSMQIKTNPDTLSYVDVVVPSIWTWSHSTGDIAVTGGGSPTITISGDTVQLTGATVTSADSLTLQILNITPPDSTDRFTFTVLTAGISDSLLPINVQPSVLVYGLPRPIGEVKTNDVNGVPLLLNKFVTVRGIVTVANEFHGPAYIQDNSGGIGLFDSTFSLTVNVGDEVVVTGTMSPFNGLCELGNVILHEITSSGNTVTPQLVTVTQLKNDGVGGVENYEGLLVRVNAAIVTDTFNVHIPSWTVSGSGTNYRLTDASGFMDIRVDNNVDFANTPAPQGTFDIIGVMGQFKAASPFIGGYQFMPRSSADIIASGPIFATFPVESNLTPTSFRVSWTTVNNGTSRLRYGTTKSYELGTIEPDNTLRTSHAIDVTGLSPATIYHVQAFSVSGPDTSTAGDLIVSTSSLGSSGQINVYFNKTVDNSVAIGQNALGNQDFVSLFLNRINNANHSIDMCFYSFSGTGEGNVLANALVAAKNRGVSVRAICEHDNRSTTAFTTLTNNGIPLIDDTYDVVWGGAGLMHDKFCVIDYRGGTPDSIWVRTGSWNPTDPGTNQDRQNVIEIQDAALAGAYTTEFNEMWGSSTGTPNQSLSHFGARKTDNTPHHFIIGGVPVESYFSPSDHTTSHIASTFHQAQHSISACILTFTRKDLADSIIVKKNAGKKTRVVIDNNTDTGNQFAYLQSNSIDVHLKGGSGLLHHKYATIDGDQVGGVQYTVTGSHNWSNSAENSNDENTLIIQNPRIANLYLQEFVARYYEAGGTDSIHVTTSPLFSVAPASINYDSVFAGSSKQDSVTVTNGGNATLNISGISSTNALFTIVPTTASIAPSASQKIYITFSPLVAGAQSASIIFTHDAPGTPDTVLVQGSGKAVGDGSVTKLVDIMSGWNMLSVPLSVADARKSVLFPAAISNAFAYQGSYVTRDTLRIGAGYWLKFATGQSDSVTGFAIAKDTFNVGSAWNMIGSISGPVPVAGILQQPASIVSSFYYGYNGSYVAVDTLQPGKAYWVKTTQAGQLIFSASANVPKAVPSGDLKNLQSLTITDANGRSQTLRFGDKPQGAFSVERYEAPPLPPEGGFDVRFASGRTVEICPNGLKNYMELPIYISSAISPIKINWSIDSKEGNSYNLKAAGQGGDHALPLKGTGETSIDGSVSSLVLTIAPENIPSAFALGQNYPNPFNPTTTIPFALPHASTVTLKVYDILGQQVAALLDNEQRDAGFYTVTVDASHLPSGVYFYRIRATTAGDAGTLYQEQKKFLLLK